MRMSLLNMQQNSIQHDVTLEEIRRKENIIDKYMFYSVMFPVIFTGYGIILYFLAGRFQEISQVIKISIIVCFIMAILSCGNFVIRKRKVTRELEDLKKETKENFEETNSEVDYFNTLVSVNIKNLGDYYELVKESNAKSFWTSLGIACAGIGFIIFGIIVGAGDEKYKDITYVSSASGIFIELVTGILFYLYNRTVIQLKEYHSSLLDVQNVLLSFKLIGDIKNDNIRIDLIKDMISSLNKHS